MIKLGQILVVAIAFCALSNSADAEPPPWYGRDLQSDLPAQKPRTDDLYKPTISTGSQGGEPATDEPATDEPATDEPTTDEPATDEPATDEPATDEPATDEPATDEPAIDEPATDELFSDDTDHEAFERVGITGPRPPDLESDPPQWWRNLVDWLESFDSPDVDMAGVLKVLGWGALVLLVLAIAGALFRVFRKFELPAKPPETLGTLHALRELTRAQPHDVHAHAGSYDLAIHALLLDALVRLARRHPIVEAPSTTSREVAQNLEPTPGPLSALVRLSETSIFALMPATETHYEHARALHAQIVEGLR